MLLPCLVLALAGCDVAGFMPAAGAPTDPPATAARTQTAMSAKPLATETQPGTPIPVASETPAAALQAATGSATAVSEPTPTVPCYQVEYLRDVRILDGTHFDPGEILLKTWRVRNSGSCRWNAGVTLSFLSGDPLAGPAGLPAQIYQPGAQLDPRLDEINWIEQRRFELDPGEQGDLVAFFRAPDVEGEYRSLWQLTGPEGQAMGQVYLFIRVDRTQELSLRSWSGLWRQQAPDAGGSSSQLVLEQSGSSLEGYYYDASGVPQWIEATVSSDGLTVEGAVGEPWTDGLVFYLGKLAGGYQFQGRLEGGPFAVLPWCAARGSAPLPLDRCLLDR